MGRELDQAVHAVRVRDAGDGRDDAVVAHRELQRRGAERHVVARARLAQRLDAREHLGARLAVGVVALRRRAAPASTPPPNGAALSTATPSSCASASSGSAEVSISV